MSAPTGPLPTCTNGCDLAYYGTHQPGCGFLPHDDSCPCEHCLTTGRSVAAYLVNNPPADDDDA